MFFSLSLSTLDSSTSWVSIVTRVCVDISQILFERLSCQDVFCPPRAARKASSLRTVINNYDNYLLSWLEQEMISDVAASAIVPVTTTFKNNVIVFMRRSDLKLG